MGGCLGMFIFGCLVAFVLLIAVGCLARAIVLAGFSPCSVLTALIEIDFLGVG